MHLLRSASRQPRNGNPVIFTRMHHTEVCASLYMKMKMPITTTSPRIISLRFISKKFPRLLAEREIIANASIVQISPRTEGKDTIIICILMLY